MNSPAIESLLERLFPVWDKLTRDERALLRASARARTYPAGAAVHNGSSDCIGVILVARGVLRVFALSEEGREITLFRMGAGSTCTLSASCVLPSITFDVFIDAQTDCDLVLIDPRCYQTLMEGNPYVEAFTYRQTAERFSEVMWVMQQVLFVSFDRRLAGYLVTESTTQASLSIAITHERIARDLGSAREVVSRMLKYFEREGWVKLTRGTVTILDEQRLRALAR